MIKTKEYWMSYQQVVNDSINVSHGEVAMGLQNLVKWFENFTT